MNSNNSAIPEILISSKKQKSLLSIGTADQDSANIKLWHKNCIIFLEVLTAI